MKLSIGGGAGGPGAGRARALLLGQAEEVGVENHLALLL
jgi:hypothetical protein